MKTHHLDQTWDAYYNGYYNLGMLSVSPFLCFCWCACSRRESSGEQAYEAGCGAVISTAFATPVLAPLTVVTTAIAVVLAVAWTATALLAFPGALIVDLVSSFFPDDPEYDPIKNEDRSLYFT